MTLLTFTWVLLISPFHVNITFGWWLIINSLDYSFWIRSRIFGCWPFSVSHFQIFPISNLDFLGYLTAIIQSDRIECVGNQCKTEAGRSKRPWIGVYFIFPIWVFSCFFQTIIDREKSCVHRGPLKRHTPLDSVDWYWVKTGLSTRWISVVFFQLEADSNEIDSKSDVEVKEKTGRRGHLCRWKISALGRSQWRSAHIWFQQHTEMQYPKLPKSIINPMLLYSAKPWENIQLHHALVKILTGHSTLNNFLCTVRHRWSLQMPNWNRNCSSTSFSSPPKVLHLLRFFQLSTNCNRIHH